MTLPVLAKSCERGWENVVLMLCRYEIHVLCAGFLQASGQTLRGCSSSDKSGRGSASVSVHSVNAATAPDKNT